MSASSMNMEGSGNPAYSKYVTSSESPLSSACVSIVVAVELLISTTAVFVADGCSPTGSNAHKTLFVLFQTYCTKAALAARFTPEAEATTASSIVMFDVANTVPFLCGKYVTLTDVTASPVRNVNVPFVNVTATCVVRGVSPVGITLNAPVTEPAVTSTATI